MTMAEILKKFGIADDVQNNILKEMKDNKIFTASEENLDVRYGKLKGDHESKLNELAQANTLIEELRASTAGNVELQNKIAEHQAEMEKLKAENQKIKVESAVKVALLAEKAVDVDYLTFKLKEKGDLALDENEKIKGWDEVISALKTQFPKQFETSTSKKIEENKLEKGDKGGTISKEQFNKMGYSERLKLHKENPEEYNKLTGKGE